MAGRGPGFYSESIVTHHLTGKEFTMALKDSAGYAVTGATTAALDAFEQASHQLRCLVGDPVATIDQAIEAAPGMPMAHAMKAWLHLLGTEPEALPVARACIEQGERLGGRRRARTRPPAGRPPGQRRPVARGRPRAGGPERRLAA